MNGHIVIASGREEKAAPYVEALKAVGVPAERIVVTAPGHRAPEALAARLHGAAGLVLSGGVDVEPERYGETVRPSSRVETFPERDALEWELLAAARGLKIPTWCICRGLQVANVFLGGTLWQDLPSQLAGPVPHEVSEPLDALAHSLAAAAHGSLAARLGGEALLVNSRHHQAIKDLAPGLSAAAWSADGLIEAVELTSASAGGWWLRGVQWHPENLVALGLHRALWADFAGAVAGGPGETV